MLGGSKYENNIWMRGFTIAFVFAVAVFETQNRSPRENSEFCYVVRVFDPPTGAPYQHGVTLHIRRERWSNWPMRKRYGRSKNTFCAAQRLTNFEIYVLSAMLLWKRLFWFNFFPCSGMTPKVQTVQGEQVLLKLGV